MVTAYDICRHQAAPPRPSTVSSLPTTRSLLDAPEPKTRNNLAARNTSLPNKPLWISEVRGLMREPHLSGLDVAPPRLEQVARQIFARFENNGNPVEPEHGAWPGHGGNGFGNGTVHHAVGTLRMPYRTSYDGAFQFNSVVDEDLRVGGTQHLYVCDMSVMPFSSAANPVRTLAALTLRLSQHFG